MIETSSLLSCACRMGHADVVRMLLSQPNTKHIRHFLTGTTPLMEAQAGSHSSSDAHSSLSTAAGSTAADSLLSSSYQ